MLEPENKGGAERKAYEIAYAVFRMASNMEERGIAEELKKTALQILVAILGKNHEEAEKSSMILDYLIKFGADLNMMSLANGEVLMKELGGLRAMIAGSVHAATGAEAMDASAFFSKQMTAASEPAAIRFPQKENSFTEAHFSSQKTQEVGQVSVSVSEPEVSQAKDNPTNSFLKSGMRQMAILDKIRQSGNCRMRDLQEILPDSSERTIRYDIEELIERRLIERVGNGGPSLYYRVRQT